MEHAAKGRSIQITPLLLLFVVVVVSLPLLLAITFKLQI